MEGGEGPWVQRVLEERSEVASGSCCHCGWGLKL